MFKVNKKIKKNKGMTYVELIVVLSIFGIMSSIVLFNYNKFQAKVDIKNLANDIALKIVQAQKDAMSGKIPVQTIGDSWRPSYGVYFDLSYPKSFIYFADLPPINQLYDQGSGCDLGGECLDDIEITKGKISKIEECSTSTEDCLSPVSTPNPLSITFTRPNSGASFFPSLSVSSNYIRITVSSSDNSFDGYIRVYPSGRIQVN